MTHIFYEVEKRKLIDGILFIENVISVNELTENRLQTSGNPFSEKR